MDARFEFQDDGLRVQLKAIRDAASDQTPLMEIIGARLEQSARTRIESTNEAPDGTPWPKSFRVTIGQGGKTLLDRGRFRDGLTHLATPNEAEVGTNAIQAGVHQFGATITAKTAKGLFFRLADGSEVVVGSVTIPARPYLGISREDEEVITQDLVPAWLLGGLADG